jgi:hypothetical protein
LGLSEDREGKMSDRNVEWNQEEWLNAKWSTWGCVSVIGSLLIAGLAIVTVIYGIFTIPVAFGPQGILSPDPALQPPFAVPVDEKMLEGIPPIGVKDFSTRQPLLVTDTVVFAVTRSARDWSPRPPRAPEVEYTVAWVRLENTGDAAVPFGPAHFQLETALGQRFQPVQEPAMPELLEDDDVGPGEAVEGILLFARPSIEEVRRYLLYDPPFREGIIRILLVP